MRRSLVLALCAIALVGSAAAPTPAAAEYPIKECGRMNLGLYVDNITSRRTSCSRARGIARAYIRGGYRTKRVSGFRCREVQQGIEVWDVRCTKPGGWVVRFQYGA